jgi:hypothetical protein
MNNRAIVTLDEDEDYTKADFGYTKEERELARTGDNTAIWMVGMITAICVSVGRIVLLSKIK